jgi:hypothetical protein
MPISINGGQEEEGVWWSNSSTESPQRAEIERIGEVRVTGGLGPLHGQHLQADEQILHTTIEINEDERKRKERR